VDVGGEVTIRLSQSNGCVFTISNTGELLTKDECETIWTSFYQKDSTRIGSGLGLAIVKSLSELHGGHVRAYSDTMNHFEVKI
jgi:signal transduction histidine kinase